MKLRHIKSIVLQNTYSVYTKCHNRRTSITKQIVSAYDIEIICIVKKFSLTDFPKKPINVAMKSLIGVRLLNYS